MLRQLKVLISLVLCVLLAACSSAPSNRNVAKQAETIPPIVVPHGAHAPKLHAYFKVPAVPSKITHAGTVTLLPPGSQRWYKRSKSTISKTKHQQSKRSHVKQQTQKKISWARLPNGTSGLIIAQSKRGQAWTRVGRALHQSSYQILDQDSGMGTYYILDTKKTGNKVTDKTPIYHLLVKQVGDHSEVLLTNQHNKPLDSKVTHRVLATLLKQLS